MNLDGMPADELRRQCISNHFRYCILSTTKVKLEVERKTLEERCLSKSDRSVLLRV
jgi:hypothetical protein